MQIIDLQHHLIAGVPSPIITWEDGEGNLIKGEGSQEVVVNSRLIPSDSISNKKTKRFSGHIDSEVESFYNPDNKSTILEKFDANNMKKNIPIGTYTSVNILRLRDRNEDKVSPSYFTVDLNKIQEHTLSVLADDSFSPGMLVQTTRKMRKRNSRSPLSKLNPSKSGFRHGSRNGLDENELKSGHKKSLEAIVSKTLVLKRNYTVRELKCSASNSPILTPISMTVQLENMGEKVLFVFSIRALTVSLHLFCFLF